MKKEISNQIASTLPELTEAVVEQLLEIPPNISMGDYALPCFTLVKLLHKNPNIIAKDIKKNLMSSKCSIFEKVEVMNGYLNLYLNKPYYVKRILKDAIDESDLTMTGKGKTICIDYSSPNIAKNFHIGHLRTTIIGNSLYKIYEKLGFTVVRINHLGDWGTQFGKLIVAYKNWSTKAKVEEDGIQELLRIYVLFHDKAKVNPSLLDKARSCFVKMEQGDQEVLAIWDWFKKISMIEFQRAYQLLGVEFDSYAGESFYSDKIPKVVNELVEKGLLVESQGAKIVNLTDYNMPPCLITKSDGSSIYPSRDIATILYRKETYHFDQCIYVTGSEQQLHFAQVFQVVALMGYEWSHQLVHVPYGLVSLSGEKLSTRTGNIVYAEDILTESITRAKQAIKEKNPTLAKKEETAHMVGVGAIIFHDLYHQRIKNVDFSWKEVLSFEGAS